MLKTTGKTSTLQRIRASVRERGNEARARVSRSFFKTGPGEYAEGDVFLGTSVPEIRKIAKECKDISDADVMTLLKSQVHEERLLALIVIVMKCKKGDERECAKWFTTYLSHTDYVNNWDLVDTSAEYVVGAYLADKPKDTLLELAHSPHLWERRIAMVATFAFIKKGECDVALQVAEILVHDRHDLIQKAVGWMLREVGKRCGMAKEEVFLQRFAATMPRTMLRYALEHFPDMKRRHYMSLAKRA